jgi:hypothetical protein
MNKKMTGYTIVLGKTDAELTQQVVDLMAKGWEPVGGASPATNQHGEPVLMQTLVRTAENAPSRRKI